VSQPSQLICNKERCILKRPKLQKVFRFFSENRISVRVKGNNSFYLCLKSEIILHWMASNHAPNSPVISHKDPVILTTTVEIETRLYGTHFRQVSGRLVHKWFFEAVSKAHEFRLVTCAGLHCIMYLTRLLHGSTRLKRKAYGCGW
jgi:hypothetical protein